MSHNTSHGWIKLHRSLLEHPLWLNSTNEQRVILVTLLMLANHTEKKWEWQGRPYTCKPGQLITSQESLRKKCSRRISRRQIQIALKRFEDMNFIEPTGNQEGIERATNKNDKECKNERTPYIPQTGEGGVSEGALRLLRMVGLSPQQTGGSQDE